MFTAYFASKKWEFNTGHIVYLYFTEMYEKNVMSSSHDPNTHAFWLMLF